jgi:hypothetical protein
VRFGNEMLGLGSENKEQHYPMLSWFLARDVYHSMSKDVNQTDLQAW